ncbi:unnamed protein product [Vitrella brassicaformis CCMP3155]|uniref:Uncharacterized protein n=1 Tax=Vitrella brassicaformis (strain CCMP3155) TaxID=1169540 RepID=A0A0G4H467_VITBC|nr:unnamed protein product [Vitrella brassicaformis CCMP3155]|eukprot:CEM38548.1 unnamed protein product [Vitrella brassicaformis CCMP3155]
MSRAGVKVKAKQPQVAKESDKVGRVGLAHLEAECVYEVGGFLTTIQRKPLSLVCQKLHKKTTEATYGILYRDLTISNKEYDYWKKIKLTDTLKTRLSKLKTAFIETDGDEDVLPAAVECIEASNATLVRICVDDPRRVCHEPNRHYFGRVGNTERAGVGKGTDREPVVFEKTQQLHITHTRYLDLVKDRKSMFPSLEVLSMGKVCGGLSGNRISHLPGATHIVSASPKITSIKADVIDVTEGDEWEAFTSSLSGCPKLTSISGLHLVPPKKDYRVPDRVEYIYDPLGRLTTALDTNWRTQHMKGVDKTITIHHRFSFGADFSRQLTDRSGSNHFALQDLLTWAEETKCQIVWMPREDDHIERSILDKCDDIIIDCGKEGPATTPPAPHGRPVGQLITNLTNECDAVKFVYGGAPLHDTWGPLLTFPAATKLSIHPQHYTTPVHQLTTSIPEWLVAKDQNGNNTHLPAIQHLYINASSYDAHNNSLPTGAEAARLDQLLGSLAGVRARRVAHPAGRGGAARFLHVPVPKLAYPAVKSLRVSNEDQISKGCARSVVSLLTSIKPAKASVDLTLTTESLAPGQGQYNDCDDYVEPYPGDALRALLREAERRVGSVYSVVSSWCGVDGNGVDDSFMSWMHMELVLKEGGKGDKKGKGENGKGGKGGKGRKEGGNKAK